MTGCLIESWIAQPSFTLFVSHDGSLTGGRHAFGAAAGATATEIAHDFYRIHVSDHTVEVLTSVESIERPARRTWLYLLRLLLVLILIWIVVRVSRH